MIVYDCSRNYGLSSMSKFLDWLTGADLVDNGDELRALTRGDERETFTYVPRTSLPEISQASALRVADLFACVRTLADAIASLPPRVYRRQADGSRVPAGDDQRLVRLLPRPEPGSTSADLLSTIVVHLLVHGDAFVAKYRGGDGEIVQLGCLDPQTVTVERRGQRVVYKLSRVGDVGGGGEYGPQDVLHIKAMSQDGLRGLSTVRAAGKVLQLNEGLVTYVCSWLGNSARPGGILSGASGVVPGTDDAEAQKDYAEAPWGFDREPPGMGRIAMFSGDVDYTAVEPTLSAQEFVAQRELAAKECARAFGLPAWAVNAPTGDSLTYSTVAGQNRYLVDHSLRPWAVRIERAFNADSDLLPGNAYMALDFDALLRGDVEARSAYYERALDPETGWMRRAEVRAREDLPPEETPDA
jgi:HK97 family phage portal protein